jgi:membrane protease YdiL (CAAX protease family)
MKRAARGTDHTRNLLTSLMLVFPLLVAYHAGVMLTGGLLNGADFVTQIMISVFGREHYWIFVVVVTAGFLVALALLRRKQHFHPRTVVPLLLESTIYALTMGGLISLVMIRFLHIDPPRMTAAAAKAGGPLTNLVMSFGAGVYEETVFRLGLLGGWWRSSSG